MGELFECVKNCIKFRLLTVKGNASYCFIRHITGEAIAEREGRTSKGNLQGEATQWPWMWVLLMDV